MSNPRLVLALVASAVLGAAALTACNGTTSAAPPAPNVVQPATNTNTQVEPATTNSPTPAPSPPNVWTGQGHISGEDDMFTPPDGNTGQYNGQPIDGVACAPTMSNVYHIHVFVGVYVNGVHYATPTTVGMYKPQPHPKNGFTEYANCYYDVHLHDSSGIVHVESPDPLNVPITGSIFTTQQLFDEWGITVNSTQFGQFTGPLQVYTSGQVYDGGPHNGTVYRSSYTLWTGDPNQIPLYSHEAIFFEVGPTYPTVLPNIVFYTEY
jgi:hypothetical protein